MVYCMVCGGFQLHEQLSKTTRFSHHNSAPQGEPRKAARVPRAVNVGISARALMIKNIKKKIWRHIVAMF